MTTENCLFSIVIVSNTIGADLVKTIDSVLQQKFTKFELIIKCNDLRNIEKREILIFITPKIIDDNLLDR